MASLTPTPKQQFFTAAGIPLVGGKIYTYAGGTTTPIVTYVDQAGATTNTNPIILDSRGEANIWLQPTLTYKYVVADANDVQQYTVDNISVPIDNFSFGAPPPIGDIEPDSGAFTTLSATGNVTFSGAGATVLQVGSSIDRPAAVTGMVRYNSTLSQFEGYGSTGWGTLGGGAAGGNTNQIFYANDTVITTSYTLQVNKNAVSTGPLTYAVSFTGTGTIAGTTMTIESATTGSLAIGSVIAGAGVTAGTTITALLSGAGGIGTYTVSPSQSVSITALTSDIIITIPNGGRWVVL
jgi:hypothetical protein